jgi:outer membrane protein assembly factor BamB
VVYVGTDAGILYAFNAETGDQIATRDLGSPILGTPCVADGKIYVGTESGPNDRGVLYVLDAQTLSTIWTYECPLQIWPGYLGEQITGSITVYGGAVYFGTSYLDEGDFHGRLRTVDLTTHQDRSSSPAAIKYPPHFCGPAIDIGFATGPRAYVSDTSCWITAIQCSDGLKKWEWKNDDAGMYSSPTVYDGHIFVGAGVNCVYRLADNPNLQGEILYQHSRRRILHCRCLERQYLLRLSRPESLQRQRIDPDPNMGN